MLAIGGFFLQSTLPVNVTFGQALAPVSAATVSSMMMGFGWGTGGLSVPLVGHDRRPRRHRADAVGLALVPLARGRVRAAVARARASGDERRVSSQARRPGGGGGGPLKALWYDSRRNAS